MKILYLCNRLPNNENAGGILYDDILRAYGLNSFSILAVSSKVNITDFNSIYKTIPNRQYSLCFPNTNLIFRVLKKLPLLESLYILLKRRILITAIAKYASDQKCDIIFTSLRGEVLLVLEELKKATKLPFIAMIEDTVEREIDGHKILYGIKKKRYYQILPQALKLGVPGETMQDYIKKEYDVNSIILRPSYSKYSSCGEKNIADEFNIFFSGNIYAQKEFTAFLSSLALLKSQNPRLTINMYIATHRRIHRTIEGVNVINLGWMNEDDLCYYMEKCHISYLPYKSEHAYRHSMKYAFPGKAGFYISNNLPIFFHGPEYSSFKTFNKIYQIGMRCDSFKATVIVRSLERFISDKNYYDLCQANCNKAHYKEFRTRVFRERVAELFSNKK